MATLGKEFQPLVKDASSVLVGVAQVRVGRPSIRPVGTAAIKAVQFVGTSLKLTDTSTGSSIDYIKPDDMSTGGSLPAGCTLASAGTYTGAYDGCFIIRALSSTTVDIFAPNGYKDAAVLISTFASTPVDMKLAATAGTSGCTIVGIPATTVTAGMTWSVPVWSGLAQDKVQTGIVTPYSMFSGSNESVGGLKAASVTPKIEAIKTLESGFPAVISDRVVEKTSVDVKFDAFEYNNVNIAYLKTVVSQVINDAVLPSLPVEVVMRTRGNSLVCLWIPNAGVTQFPSYAPTNDFSSLAWELGATKLTEVSSETNTYNVWAKYAPIMSELTYVH